MHGALVPVAFDRHAAGDGHSESDIEGAIRLGAGVADGVEEILHVCFGIAPGQARHFVAVGPGLFFRRVADALYGVGDGAVVAQRLFSDTEPFVAEARIPGEEHLVVLHGDVHGVGHFAAVLPQVEAAGHGDRLGNSQAHRLVPEGNLVAHVLVHVAARIVPEEAPVGKPVGVKRPLRRLAEERLPHDVFGRHVGIDGIGPLRFSVRRVAVHVGVNHGDLAHQLGLEKAERVGELSGRGPLVPDLHDALFAGVLVRRAHALGVVHRERHGLFLVDVLAGIERGGEAFGVQMLRGGDQYGIDILVLQQAAIVKVGFGVGRNAFHVFQAAGVDVGRADAFGVGAGDRLAENLGAAGAGSDDADADALVCAKNSI